MVFLLVIVLFTNMSVYAFGQELSPNSSQGALSVSSGEGKAGEKVALTVSIKGNTGITSLDFSIDYDKEALKLISAENGTVLGGYLGGQNYETTPYYCGWLNALQREDVKKDGVLLRLNFEIKDNAAPGQYRVRFTDTKITGYNANLEAVVFSGKDGTIKVVGEGEKPGTGDQPKDPTKDQPGQTAKPDNNPGNSDDNQEKLIQAVKAMEIQITKQSLNSKKGRFQIQYKKSNGKVRVDGYQIWRSAKKSSGYKKAVTTVQTKWTDKTVKKLKKGRHRYYKVRGYRDFAGKRYYTHWSKKVHIKVN